MPVKRRNPDWALLGVAGVENLPAVRWRLENLAKLDDNRHAVLLFAFFAASIGGVSPERPRNCFK